MLVVAIPDLLFSSTECTVPVSWWADRQPQ